MSDLFRSALNNISSNWNIGSNSDQNSTNDSLNSDNQFVGQTIELKGIKLRVERVIAEGIDWFSIFFQYFFNILLIFN